MTNKSVEQVSSAPRLPGRFYTFLVTSLAVILAILPFVAAQNLQWKTTAIIEHPTPNTSTATEATIVDGIRSVIEQAQASAPSLPLPNAHDLRINLNISSVELADPTKSRTTLTLETPDRQVSESISSLFADRLLAETGTDGNGKLISLSSEEQAQLSRTEFLSAFIFAVCFGLITLFYPRMRTSKKDLPQVSEIETLTEAPVLGSVFLDEKAIPQPKLSTSPLRLTVFAAEIVVVAAFFLVLYLAASNTNFANEFASTPLDAYTQGVLEFTTPAAPLSDR